MAERGGRSYKWVERKAESLSEIAAGYFRKVSAKYPASVTAQAAAIAMMCQDSGHKPKELEMALLRDGEQLQEIADLANKLHGARNPDAPTDITSDRVSEIVASDFRKAARWVDLTRTQLGEILDLYPVYIQPGNRGEGELEYLDAANTKLRVFYGRNLREERIRREKTLSR